MNEIKLYPEDDGSYKLKIEYVKTDAFQKREVEHEHEWSCKCGAVKWHGVTQEPERQPETADHACENHHVFTGCECKPTPAPEKECCEGCKRDPCGNDGCDCHTPKAEAIFEKAMEITKEIARWCEDDNPK